MTCLTELAVAAVDVDVLVVLSVSWTIPFVVVEAEGSFEIIPLCPSPETMAVIVTFLLPSIEAEPVTSPPREIVLDVPHLLVVISLVPSNDVPLILLEVVSFVALNTFFALSAVLLTLPKPT